MCVRSHNVMIVSADTCKYSTSLVTLNVVNTSTSITVASVTLKLQQLWPQTQALFAIKNITVELTQFCHICLVAATTWYTHHHCSADRPLSYATCVCVVDVEQPVTHSGTQHPGQRRLSSPPPTSQTHAAELNYANFSLK